MGLLILVLKKEWKQERTKAGGKEIYALWV